MESVHKTVLLNETIAGLNLDESKSLVIDATFGGGGHSREICLKFPHTKIIALDQDKTAFQKAESKFKGLKCDIKFVNTNFRDIEKTGERDVDGIIMDLGLSSDQLENSGRGFSFKRDEPLLMTMKANPSPEELTAREVVNDWEENNLADIIYGYGEEKYARRIARAICMAREEAEIKTTADLAEIILRAVPDSYKRSRIHPATRTFQALRIAVNDELVSLQEGLSGGFEILKSDGRMAVITFHSLEDRIVKKFFIQKQKSGRAKLINKKPIVPTEEEIKNNPRARSAKLRIIEKI